MPRRVCWFNHPDKTVLLSRYLFHVPLVGAVGHHRINVRKAPHMSSLKRVTESVLSYWLYRFNYPDPYGHLSRSIRSGGVGCMDDDFKQLRKNIGQSDESIVTCFTSESNKSVGAAASASASRCATTTSAASTFCAPTSTRETKREG